MTDIERQTRAIDKGFERLASEIEKGFRKLGEQINSSMQNILGVRSPSKEMQEKVICYDGFGDRVDVKTKSPWVIFDKHNPETWPPSRKEVLIKVKKQLGVSLNPDLGIGNELGFFRHDIGSWVIYGGQFAVNIEVEKWMMIPEE